MIVDVSRIARMKGQEGKLLVYVHYVQRAPWNISNSIGSDVKYRRCGTVMLGKAVEYSASLKSEGRVGLHSLPSTIDFYKRKIGMTALGLDRRHQNLMYLETTYRLSKSILNLGD